MSTTTYITLEQLRSIYGTEKVDALVSETTGSATAVLCSVNALVDMHVRTQIGEGTLTDDAVKMLRRPAAALAYYDLSQGMAAPEGEVHERAKAAQALLDRISTRVKGTERFELMLPVVPVEDNPDTPDDESAGQVSAGSARRWYAGTGYSDSFDE